MLGRNHAPSDEAASFQVPDASVKTLDVTPLSSLLGALNRAGSMQTTAGIRTDHFSAVSPGGQPLFHVGEHVFLLVGSYKDNPITMETDLRQCRNEQIWPRHHQITDLWFGRQPSH